MSSIDKALNRSRQPQNANAMSPEPADRLRPSDSVPIPSPDAFKAPWSFEADASPIGGNGHEPSGVGETAHEGTEARDSLSIGDGSERGRVDGSSAVAATVDRSTNEVALAVAQTDPLVDFRPDVRERLVVGDHDENRKVMAVAVEQYRRLAATLHHARIERDIRCVMITSAVASEGKTLTATNIALTLAESYRRTVLLIDADLRRPSLHDVFQVPNVTGLKDGLREDAQPKMTLLQVTPHLTLIPAGSPDPDPMSLLTSPSMHRILQEGRARYDWVIVDAPPVGLLTDANLLAKMVDATLLVVEAAKTDYPIVRRAVEAIGRERVLGVVLNKVDLPQGSYGYKYDKYYAAYYAPKKKQ